MTSLVYSDFRAGLFNVGAAPATRMTSKDVQQVPVLEVFPQTGEGDEGEREGRQEQSPDDDTTAECKSDCAVSCVC